MILTSVHINPGKAILNLYNSFTVIILFLWIKCNDVQKIVHKNQLSLHCTFKLPSFFILRNAPMMDYYIPDWDNARGGWSVLGWAIELKAKCSYRGKPICPKGVFITLFGRDAACWAETNHSKLRGNHSNLSSPHPQSFVPLLWWTLTQNRTKQWKVEQIPLWGWARAQNNAPLTRIWKSASRYIGVCSLNYVFFFFGPYWESLQESYELTRHFNYNW